MEAYRTPSKESQEFILANVTYEAVIEGLNGYFASEPKNDYITVKMESDKQDFALYEAEAWADILIEWLRKNHDIFYRPGLKLDQVEAARSAAKICCLRAHIKDEISKRGLWCDKDADIPALVDTLFEGYDGCVKRADKNRADAVKLSKEIRCVVNAKESEIKNLKERIAELESNFKAVCDEDDIFRTRALKAEEEVRNLNAELATKWTKTSLINWLQQEARHKGVELDDVFLYSDDTPIVKITEWTDIVDFLFDEIVKMRREIKSKESGIEDLKEHITLLEADLKKAKMEKEKFLIEVADREEEIESLQNKDYDVYLEHRQYIIKSIMCNIRQDASRNGFDLPEKVDGEPLSIERTFHDLLELLMKRTKEVKEARKKHWNDLRDIHKALGRDGTCDSIDGFAKAVKARAEYVESLSRNAERETQKSDINKLIREYCTKHDIVAPSRYLGDEACIEYLFSVVDLEQKHRAVVGKQMVDDYEKDLLKFIYKEYKDRTHLSDKIITYDPPSVRNTITKIIRDYASCRYAMDILETQIKSIFDKYKAKFTVDDYVLNGDPTSSFMLSGINSWIDSPAKSRGKTRAEIENYKLSLKDYILKGIKEHGYRYDGLETKSIEELVDWTIMLAACDRSGIALRDIYTTVASPVERRRYNIDNCDGVVVDHMKDYILRRFEGLHANTEYCLKKMSELDGCKKNFETLKEKQEFLSKQNMELSCKICAKDDEISRLKGLINVMNEEVGDM